MKKAKTRNIINIIFSVVILGSTIFYASSGGVTGKTQKNGNGCDCHGPQPSSSVLVSIQGPDTLTINQTANYTLKISGGPAVRAGTNIASSNGLLDVVSSNLKKLGSELTHTSPTAFVDGIATFEFSYTAPASEGTEIIYANGNSVNNDGNTTGDQWNFAPQKNITVVSVTSVEDEQIISSYRLYQNYPNPFNPATTIAYYIPEESFVTLVIYDLQGKEIARPVEQYQSGGHRELTWNANNLASGVYLYKIEAVSVNNSERIFTDVRKMNLLK